MRVVLRFESGEGKVRKTLLGNSQVLQIGRTEWADFCVPHDGTMSPVHFSLSNEGDRCCVQDLASDGGTFVNGQRIETAALRDGDRILAGRSTFRVDIEGGPTETRRRDLDESPTARVVLPAVPKRPGVDDNSIPASSPIEYRPEKCRSGLSLFRGSTKQVGPATVARLLAEELPLYLIVDFGKLEFCGPEPSEDAECLLDFLPEETRQESSPRILTPGGDGDRFEVLEAGWGNDAVIGVYPEAEKVDVLRKLRSALGVYIRPSLMLPQLTQSAPVFADNVFSELGAVLLEGQTPEQWIVVAREGLDQTFQKLGFRREAGKCDSEEES